MTTRLFGDMPIHPIGLGAMNCTGGYGAARPEEECDALLNRALDLGYTHLDTAACYGHGLSEQMIGRFLKKRRGEYVLSSKFGILREPINGKLINNDPRLIGPACEESLRNLKTDWLDLFYLHRWDPSVPIEEVVGALSRLIEAGKVRQIGLSEVSAATLRKAHAERPIAALQSEYSLWTRNPEIAVLDACKELGTTFVAFSPLGRQFLTGAVPARPDYGSDDIRHTMPRFEPETLAKNAPLLAGMREIAERADCSLAQLALAWVLTRGEHVIAIPGTANMAHLEENISGPLDLPPALVEELDALINANTVIGARYPAKAQATVDTECFEHETAA